MGVPPCSLNPQPKETKCLKNLIQRSNGEDRYSDQNGKNKQSKTHGTKKVQQTPAIIEPAIWIMRCKRSGRMEISDQNGIMPRPAQIAALNILEIVSLKWNFMRNDETFGL